MGSKIIKNLSEIFKYLCIKLKWVEKKVFNKEIG